MVQIYGLTSEENISCTMSCKSKKMLARRAGHWKVVGTESVEERFMNESESDDDDDEEDEVDDEDSVMK